MVASRIQLDQRLHGVSVCREEVPVLDQLQREQVAAHAVVQSRRVQHELALGGRRDLGRAAESLQRLLPDLLVEDDEGRVIGGEEPAFNVNVCGGHKGG